jgi:hypothetical protein
MHTQTNTQRSAGPDGGLRRREGAEGQDQRAAVVGAAGALQ